MSMTPGVKVLAVLLAFPVFREDIRYQEDKRAQLQAIATAVERVAESKEEAALMLASGWQETGWSLRIHAGGCKPYECDHGQARGPWQVHQNELGPEKWERMTGIANTEAQAMVVVWRLRFWKRRCGNTWGAIARYFGLPCRSDAAPVARRFRAYKEVLHALGD